MPISVSRSPRLTHPCPHLFAELEKLAFLVVISCLRNKRVLSSGGLHMGTRATIRALLCCQNKIPSIDRPTTQTNLAIGREIWHQAPRDQFYPVFWKLFWSSPKIFFPHFDFDFRISSAASSPLNGTGRFPLTILHLYNTSLMAWSSFIPWTLSFGQQKSTVVKHTAMHLNPHFTTSS